MAYITEMSNGTTQWLLGGAKVKNLSSNYIATLPILDGNKEILTTTSQSFASTQRILNNIELAAGASTTATVNSEHNFFIVIVYPNSTGNPCRSLLIARSQLSSTARKFNVTYDLTMRGTNMSNHINYPNQLELSISGTTMTIKNSTTTNTGLNLYSKLHVEIWGCH